MSEEKFCKNCGKQINGDFKFCPNCGTKTNKKMFLLEESWFSDIVNGLCIYFIIDFLVDIFKSR